MPDVLFAEFLSDVRNFDHSFLIQQAEVYTPGSWGETGVHLIEIDVSIVIGETAEFLTSWVLRRDLALPHWGGRASPPRHR